MPAETRVQAQSESPVHRHEPSDIRIRWIVVFTILLAVSAVIIHIGLWWMLGHLGRAPGKTDAWTVGTKVRPVVNEAPPPPRLQLTPVEDLAEFRIAEERTLNSYGWIDRPAGVARIPIDVAMDILTEQGLPVRQGTGTAAAGPSPLEFQYRRASSEASPFSRPGDASPVQEDLP